MTDYYDRDERIDAPRSHARPVRSVGQSHGLSCYDAILAPRLVRTRNERTPPDFWLRSPRIRSHGGSARAHAEMPVADSKGTDQALTNCWRKPTDWKKRRSRKGYKALFQSHGTPSSRRNAVDATHDPLSQRRPDRGRDQSGWRSHKTATQSAWGYASRAWRTL